MQLNRMDSSTRPQRRQVLLWLGAGLVGGCSWRSKPPEPPLSAEEQRLKDKFRGIYGMVTRIDAVGYPKEYVTISNENGSQMDGSGRLTPKNVKYSAYGGRSMPIPRTVRAVWRTGAVKFVGKWTTVGKWTGWDGGTVLGDYTVPVAERIPDEVLDYIRKNGGALRLKIRLHDTGVWIGWDIEMRLPLPNLPPNYQGAKNYLEYRMPGGDFREDHFDPDTRKMIKGWYIDKNGQKIPAD